MEKEKKMGFVHIRVGISKLNEQNFKYYYAMVDTGATLTVIPSKIAEENGIKREEAKRVLTGSGTAIMYEGRVDIEINGERLPQRIWISDSMERILIGVTTLEQLGLSVDPKKGTLRKEEFLLYALA